MKKVLFLSFNYPSGDFGPSTNCTLRIMKAMCESGRYEVHCISYPTKGKDLYEIIPGIILHRFPFKSNETKLPRWAIRLSIILWLPLYPISKPLACFRLYRATRNLIIDKQYDLVVCQCYPEESLWVGTWLKKRSHIDKLLVIFWDSIYGKLPRRGIPKSFALRRQRWVEGFVARNANRIVSLYPLKPFHEKNGEIPQALGKRTYLGIPSVIRPRVLLPSTRGDAIVEKKINILYSGTIFREQYVRYLIDLLNSSPLADSINLVFFQRGISSSSWNSLKMRFRGTIYESDWIPLHDLLALYPRVDFFMSYPGNPTAIRSKLFEYVSYGKPIMILYDDDADVNITTFSSYPACSFIDVRLPISERASSVSLFLQDNKGRAIPFDEVESLFSADSPKAYIELIDHMLM